jgi:chemotaxis family two-component system sensor kinase Cph1
MEDKSVVKEYENMTREELIAELEKLQSPSWARDADGLNNILEQLRIHQVELEMQNQELREAQQELEESRNRYADLYDFAPVGYASLDDTGLIHDINLTGSTMLGMERGRLVGMPLFRHVLFEDRGLFLEHMRRCRQTGEKVTTELRLVAKDNTAINVELSSVPYKRASGNAVLYRTVMMDITERKRMEEELRRGNEELKAFAHTISHDLRGSLAIIEGFSVAAFSALERGDNREEVESLEHVIKGARRAQGYIESLLEYAMAVHEEGVVLRAATDEVLVEVLIDYGEEIREKGVEMVIEKDLPPVKVDPIRLRQVLMNLIGNAIKYIGDNAKPRIEIGARTEGETVILHISDNGVGIQREDQDKIFEPFKRFTSDGSHGLGIGLATVKRVVEGWGGNIQVESKPGEGTTFLFSAPAAV